VRDVENTVRYLRDDAVIVLHDRNPANASIACPAPSFAAFRAENHRRDFFQYLRPPKRRESSSSISPACAAAIRGIRWTAGGCSPR
jgi:hypothetical protein